MIGYWRQKIILNIPPFWIMDEELPEQKNLKHEMNSIQTSLKWISNQISTSYYELYLFNRGKERENKRERESKKEREREREMRTTREK